MMLAFTRVYSGPFFDLIKDWIRVPATPSEFAAGLTPQFGVYAEIWRQAFRQARLPTWSPTLWMGSPFWRCRVPL